MYTIQIFDGIRLKRENKAKIIIVAHKVNAIQNYHKWKWNTGYCNYARQLKSGKEFEAKNQNKENNNAPMNAN